MWLQLLYTNSFHMDMLLIHIIHPDLLHINPQLFFMFALEFHDMRI